MSIWLFSCFPLWWCWTLYLITRILRKYRIKDNLGFFYCLISTSNIDQYYWSFSFKWCRQTLDRPADLFYLCQVWSRFIGTDIEDNSQIYIWTQVYFSPIKSINLLLRIDNCLTFNVKTFVLELWAFLLTLTSTLNLLFFLLSIFSICQFF